MSVVMEARGVDAGYGSVTVVRDLNLQVESGEVVALLGRNGAGKTTALLTLAGALRPLAGEIHFLGANDPYSALKTTLKAEINAEAWATLNSDTSRPFERPKSGRIAVKVINHLGDEVMKVFKV